MLLSEIISGVHLQRNFVELANVQQGITFYGVIEMPNGIVYEVSLKTCSEQFIVRNRVSNKATTFLENKSNIENISNYINKLFFKQILSSFGSFEGRSRMTQ